MINKKKIVNTSIQTYSNELIINIKYLLIYY